MLHAYIYIYTRQEKKHEKSNRNASRLDSLFGEYSIQPKLDLYEARVREARHFFILYLIKKKEMMSNIPNTQCIYIYIYI